MVNKRLQSGPTIQPRDISQESIFFSLYTDQSFIFIMPSRKESLNSKRKITAAQGPSKKRKSSWLHLKRKSFDRRNTSWTYIASLSSFETLSTLILTSSLLLQMYIFFSYLLHANDQGTFGLMARYFGCAFSAYASEDLQNNLLELICTTHGKIWHKDAAYQHIWRE